MQSQAQPDHTNDRKIQPKSMTRFTGFIWMSLAIVVWASWLVLTSSGNITTLSPVDLAGFRALVPGVVLAPMLWRYRHQVAQLGLARCLLLSAYGAPFTLCVGYGLGFAPVAHAGAMVPGLMPVVATVIGVLIFGQRLSMFQTASALLIGAGALAIVLRPDQGAVSHQTWIGHALFLTGAICWACFAVTVRRNSIAPFLATAIVGVVSSVCLVPVWLFSGTSMLAEASVFDIAFQFVFQGILTGLVALYAFGRALYLIGPIATRFSALTPAMATVIAIPVLSQVPDLFEVLALSVVVIGLALGSVSSRSQRPGAATSASDQQG